MEKIYSWIVLAINLMIGVLVNSEMLSKSTAYKLLILEGIILFTVYFFKRKIIKKTI